MVAVLIGLATSLTVTTSQDQYGSFLSANWAWGLGIMIGIYIAGGISGGHLNPAISILLCVFRGFPAKKTAVYITAQMIGAILAGLLAYGLYHDAIFAYAGTLSATSTGSSFYTQPASFTGPATSFFTEFIATGILACAILALGDDSNAPPGAGMHAFIVGLVVTVLTMAFGYNTGACLNPARDFGPRLATLIVGYGRTVFTANDCWWLWGAWGGTITGALVGGLFYDAAIFVGGESPINYPKRRRRRARMKMQKRWWRRIGRNGKKVRELEEGIKQEMDPRDE
jgi:aquaglyceroporin related protein